MAMDVLELLDPPKSDPKKDVFCGCSEAISG